MKDAQLIDYCAQRCEAINCQFEGRVFARMFQLAGEPRAARQTVESLIPRKLYALREEMLALLDLAKRRAARPVGGLKIEAGRAYRDVNGDVRYVIEVKNFGNPIVLWDIDRQPRSSRPTSPLKEFQEWALEEVTDERR